MGRDLGAADPRNDRPGEPALLRTPPDGTSRRRALGTDQLVDRVVVELWDVAYVAALGFTFFRAPLKRSGRLHGIGNANPFHIHVIKGAKHPVSWIELDASFEIAPGAMRFDLESVLDEQTLPRVLVVGIETSALRFQPRPSLVCFCAANR